MPPGAHNTAKTHCPQGHPYDEENTKIGTRGQRICRTCQRAASLAWYHRTKDKVDPEVRRESQRAAWLKRRYGLTPEEYAAMIEERENRCDICGEEPSGKGHCGILHVDHDKDTGEVRGMLCNRCNMAIGLLLHDHRLLQAAIDYLEH